jgi:lariat debranching enzyme
VDIFISHDWPTNITNFGNKKQLLKEKPFFQEDIDKGELGSPASEKLLFTLKPKFWFSGHMHCKFAAIVPHDAKGTVCTRFLALDKCLPKHDFLQIIDILDQSGTNADTQLKCFEYDVDWLSIIRTTNQYLISPHRTFKNYKIKQKAQSYLNNPYQLLDKKVLMDNKEWILGHLQSFCIPPTNFIAHAPAYNPTGSKFPAINYDYEEAKNPQTAQFLAMLQLEDYIARSHDSSTQVINDLLTKNEEEIEI